MSLMLAVLLFFFQAVFTSARYAMLRSRMEEALESAVQIARRSGIASQDVRSALEMLLEGD